MSNSLSSSSIRDFKANKAKHSEQLLELTSTKFDLGNKNHINALNEYINSFECTANQHYLFQSLCAGFKDWKLIWLLGYFVPTSITLYYFTANVAGYFLDRFSLDRFHNQLAEMEHIYNWCLKDGKEKYDAKSDNAEKLAHPEIQRLIKLMAPLIEDTKFMVAWPKETGQNQEKSMIERTVTTVGSAVNATCNAAYSVYSWFSSSNKPKVESKPTMDVHSLKVAVETRSFDVDVVSGFKQAMSYFALSPEFKKILSTEIKQIDIVPAPLKVFLATKSHVM